MGLEKEESDERLPQATVIVAREASDEGLIVGTPPVGSVLVPCHNTIYNVSRRSS